MTLMEQNYHHCDLYCVRAIYSIIAILDFSRQSPDSGICSLPRQSTTSRDVWDVSGVLL